MVILIYAVMGFVLSQTAWGRYVYAVGDDPESARLSGVPTATVKVRLHRARRSLRGAPEFVEASNV